MCIATDCPCIGEFSSVRIFRLMCLNLNVKKGKERILDEDSSCHFFFKPIFKRDVNIFLVRFMTYICWISVELRTNIKS